MQQPLSKGFAVFYHGIATPKLKEELSLQNYRAL